MNPYIFVNVRKRRILPLFSLPTYRIYLQLKVVIHTPTQISMAIFNLIRVPL